MITVVQPFPLQPLQRSILPIAHEFNFFLLDTFMKIFLEGLWNI